MIPKLIDPADISLVCKDFETRYEERRPASGVTVNQKEDGEFGVLASEQFRNIENLPFDASPAINLIALHPELIRLAREALQTEHVHLYQAHSWAKFTGDADYDQHFHCDFSNHTLTVPSDEERLRTINFVIYVTDVSNDLGALHYVSHGESDPITGLNRPPIPAAEQQKALKRHERSGAAPAGSVFAYGIDLYHRGTNLTRPGGRRFTFFASYKAQGNDMIGWTAWPVTHREPWHLVIEQATPDQLSCLGIPPPGDAFWTERTLARTAARWPGLELAPYCAAL